MFRGNHPAKVDEKGRLKLPAAFKQILDAQNVTQFYITSVDGKSARIARVIASPEAARAAPGAESPGKSTSRFSCTKAYSLTAQPSRDRGVPSGAATDQSRRSSAGDGNTHSMNEGAAAVASRERYTSPRAWTPGQPTPLSSGA